MRYAMIRDYTLSVEHGTLDLATLQELVGGNIEPVFTVASVERAGFRVTGYANEEGMYNGSEINALWVRGEHAQPVFGPVVVTGLGPRGETCELTARELAQVALVAPAPGSVFAMENPATGDLHVFCVPLLYVQTPETRHA